MNLVFKIISFVHKIQHFMYEVIIEIRTEVKQNKRFDVLALKKLNLENRLASLYDGID
jgi:hypothetical protein